MDAQSMNPDASVRILDEVVIADESPPRHRNFPSTALLRNGDLLVVYGVSADHQRTCNGALVSRRSSDGGKSWSDPHPVLAHPERHYSTTYGMVQIDDGRLMLHVWEWRFRRPEDGPGLQTLHRHKVIRVLRMFSDDGGLTWNEPQSVAPSPPFVAFEWTYGRTHELPDGRLMIPLYGPVQEGTETGDPHRSTFSGESWATAVGFSSDGGCTFPERSIVASNPSEHRLCNETDVLRLRDGRFLAIVRDGKLPRWSLRSYSADEGKTWTHYEEVNFKGECPCLVQLRSGAILCAYRDRDDDRPGMSVSVSDDDGESWRWVGQLYSGPNWDCSYPVIIRLPDGRLFCTYYTSFVDGDCEVRGMWLDDDV
jgi:hypothetical protein